MFYISIPYSIRTGNPHCFRTVLQTAHNIIRHKLLLLDILCVPSLKSIARVRFRTIGHTGSRAGKCHSMQSLRRAFEQDFRSCHNPCSGKRGLYKRNKRLRIIETQPVEYPYLIYSFIYCKNRLTRQNDFPEVFRFRLVVEFCKILSISFSLFICP